MAVNKKRLQQRAEKLRGWVRLDQKTPLLYRKEVIYQGDWKKLDSSGEGIAFAVAHNTLNHWKDSLRALREAGIKSPLTTSHEQWDQPENRLGEVTNAVVSENDKGLPSLYLDILFDDEKSRDIGLKGDVSIGSPPDVWYDGTGRKWTYPLQHVASTNTPVIPGLETWQKIAAAFSASNKSKGSKMDLDALIKQLGIKVPDGASDDVKAALITQAIDALVADEAGEGDTPPDPNAAPPKPDTNMSHEEDEAKRRAAAAAANNGGGGAVPQAKKVTVAFAHPVVVRTVRDARAAQIDAMLTQNQITPAMATELKLSFCNDDKLKLLLSHNEGEAASGDDGFDLAIKHVKLMAKERPLSASGRTPAVDDESVIELSHNAGNKGLVKNAEKRAERAKATMAHR